MEVKIEQSWKEVLAPEFEKAYFEALTNFVRQEYSTYKIYPPAKDIFKAFDLCPFSQVKAVVIGQDPYHGQGQAHGLCFSVNDNIKPPPSLVNIFKEIQNDIGKTLLQSGNLQPWAEQGVLLLNATLTVRAASPGSHQNKGWEQFTDAVIKVLNDRREQLAFILWGAYAQKKGEIIDRDRHFVVESAHPSPFAAHRGFFGSKPFSKVNEYLEAANQSPIQW